MYLGKAGQAHVWEEHASDDAEGFAVTVPGLLWVGVDTTRSKTERCAGKEGRAFREEE